MNMIKGGNQT